MTDPGFKTLNLTRPDTDTEMVGAAHAILTTAFMTPSFLDYSSLTRSCYHLIIGILPTSLGTTSTPSLFIATSYRFRPHSDSLADYTD